MIQASKRGQGAFEYILLLAGILLIVVVVITVLRVSVIPAANQTLQGALQQFQTLVSFCQDASTVTLGIDGSTATISLCQPVAPEQTTVTISSAPVTFDGSNSSDKQFMNWSSDNTTVVLNITGKTGSPLNLSEPHGVTVVVAGTALISAKATQSSCTPSEYSADASTVLLLHFNDNAPPALVADASTVGLWHFDEGQGSVAYDSSPNHNDGTLVDLNATGFGVSPPQWLAAGRVNKALVFDGFDDAVRIPKTSSFSLNDLTVEGWFKLNNATWSSPPYQSLFSSANKTVGPYMAAYTEGVGNVACKVNNGTTYSRPIGSTDIRDGRWHHVACVRNTSAGMVYAYVDGTLEASAADIAGTIVPAYDLIIGSEWRDYPYGFPVNGSVDEVAVYNRSLSASEIAAHAAAVARDSSQYSNNGTLKKGVGWTTGKYGSAVQFYGADEYVNVSDSQSLNITTNAFTLEGWFNPLTNVSWRTWAARGPWPVYPSYTFLLQWKSGVPDIWANLPSYNATGQIASNWLSASNIPLSAWTHVAYVFNGSAAAFYVNGALASSGEFIAGNGGAMLWKDLILGAGQSGASNFNGTIDEVRLLNRALNASEVYYDRWCH
jgi:hypothetical protein